MKKIILAIALFIAVEASAQSDGFFTSTYQEARGDGMGNYPALIGHGLTDHQDANAPLGLMAHWHPGDLLNRDQSMQGNSPYHHHVLPGMLM